jgi:uncharacterized membrane protein YkvA (DUF1232 family)
MPISINLELSDQDIEHFSTAMKATRKGTEAASVADVTAAATRLLEEARNAVVPPFVSERLGRLDQLIAMVRDEGWAMEAEDTQRVLSALEYFSNPDDIIPDSTPVLGYLDDAIMIEVCVRELGHELSAYEEFCDYRQHEAERRGMDPSTVGRADWLEGRREELQDRMHRRRARDYGTGYGNSSGYKSDRTYVNEAWRPSLFRTI